VASTDTGGTDSSGGTAAGSTTGTQSASTSVGASTTKATKGRVVRLSRHHSRHRVLVGRLLGP
jgi:hypothetical protein